MLLKAELAPQAHLSRDGKGMEFELLLVMSVLMADGRVSLVTKNPCLHQVKSRAKLP